ncbi:MAG: pyruvate formate-lyase-activating protein [Phycisphaeraceae bacterium JB051]
MSYRDSLNLARALSRVPLSERQTTGRLHSIESCGTVDGPGIRTVIFLQGCYLSCRFCHNPDTWDRQCGQQVTVEQLLHEVMPYRSYHQASGGGVTLSGGDPLAQPEFAQAFLLTLRELGIHSALDTSGGRPLNISQPVIDAADMVLLDVKHTDAQSHIWLTGVPQHNVLETGSYLAQVNKPVWVRHVVIPGITDDEAHFHRLGELLKQWPNVQRVDLLAYHTMHLHKWKALGKTNPLEGVPDAPQETIDHAKKILMQYALPVS